MSEENKTVSEDEIYGIAELEEMDIEALKQALVEEKERSEKYLAGWQRAEADFINYKKRTEQERSDFTSSANSILILNLLPVLDDFERAVSSLPPELSGLTWVEGIRLIHNKLKTVLEAGGLAEIEAVGQPFDPNLHEAVAYQEGEEGKVTNETQKGYKFKDKVLRATLVIVGKGQEINTEESNNSNERLI